MSIISVTNVNDGDAVTAASVNNQVNTIVNDYNGNITAPNLATGAVTTAKIAAANVTAAKLLYGTVRQRQGGATGDASWLTNGTSNTDTSAKDVFIQVGNAAASSQSTTITFPVAFNQVPLVLVTPSGSSGNFSAGWYLVTQTTTSFIFVAQDYTKVTGISWIAIGQ